MRTTTAHRFDKVALALIAVLALMAPDLAGAQAASKLTVNRIDTGAWPDVALNLTLTGPDGRAIPGVNAAQFEIREQGNPQAVAGIDLGPARSVPLALALTMDVSGSMNAESKLGQAKDAASTFLNSLRPEDSAALLAFNNRVQEVAPLASSRDALQSGVGGLVASGDTAIYDALYRSAQVLNAAPAGKRRAIILLTDGADTSSKFSAATAADVAKQAGALVYTIGLGPDANDAVLRSLAEPGGGKYYKAPSAGDLDAIYKAISIELDSQLMLRYRSSSHTERSYQLISVQVKYASADGRVLEQAASYRPPAAAVVAPKGQTAPKPAPVVTPVVFVPPVAQASANPTPQPEQFEFNLIGMSVAFLVVIALFMGTAGIAMLAKPSATKKRVDRYLVRAQVKSNKEQKGPGFMARVLLPTIESTGKALAKLSPRDYTKHIESMLVLMGPPYRMTAGIFLSIQVLLTALSTTLVMLWVARNSQVMPAQWMLALILSFGSGSYLPYVWLKRRVMKRQKAILRALPGALDFLAINVEAGMGFDAALAQVVKRWHNTLSDEFGLLLIDFQIGKPRKDAWKELLQRTQVPELNTFVTAMIQNESIGVSIGTLLRTQADQMRVKRRQAAEEAARTAPVKMLIPMVFFIFPGVFVVILGPAVPQFLSVFTHMGK